MFNNNVLIIGTSYMDIHKDIIDGFQELGFNVDFIREKSSPKDPYNLRGYKGVKRFFLVNKYNYQKKNKEYWKQTLSNEQYSKVYDYLFVLDGQSLHPYLFEELRRRNSEIKCINYLFDTTNHVYRFDKNFKYFDNVFTFDIYESNKYKIKLLPIYWKKEESQIIEYDVFAFGGYTPARYNLFKMIKKISDDLRLSSYIKIYTPPFTKVKGIKARIDGIYNFLFRENISIPREMIDSEFNTNYRIDPSDFRRFISKSRIIIDTAVDQQDGLTARFMWALGAGKKIITNNKNVLSYPFYSEKQILVVGDDYSIEKGKLCSFLVDGEFNKEDIHPTVVNYRIDNWIKTLLS